MIAILANLTTDSTFTVTLGAIFLGTGAIVTAVWRAANFVRDLIEQIKGLRKELKEAWMLRDQEMWALQLERENRARNNALFVPDVRRARTDE